MSDELDLSTCTEAQLWRHVASHLEANGIAVVLVGGAVVAVYTDGAYRSGDLDFVPLGPFGAPVEEFEAKSRDGRVRPAKGTPEGVAEALRSVPSSTRWKGVKAIGGTKGREAGKP